MGFRFYTPVVALLCYVCAGVNGEYYGKLIGKLSELHHGVSGEVYAVDGRTLYLKDFTYDGEGPGAYFYASAHKTADNRGFRLNDENNNGAVIRRYRKEGITLTLPEGKTLRDIKIFYVWCEDYDVNFGDVKISKTLDFPRPQKIDALRGVHGVSSDNIVVVDAQTLLIPNFHYDGEAPDAKFWVGRGPKPSPQGIRVPDENGKENPLRKYEGKTVVLTLPGDLTVFDIGHFGIWCEAFTVDFGHIQIPQGLNIPPSLKMLGVSPQSKLNCEVLNNDLAFEVRWAVAGESIVLQLVAKLDNREYMSFGLSGDDAKSTMIGGDVVVAWVDQDTFKGHAQDYYLADKAQCSGPTGSCPDTKFADNTNNIRLLNAALVNGYSIVTYQRPLRAVDQYDVPVFTNQSQAIIWAIGPLNQRDEVSFHSSYLKRDVLIDFARPAKWNCPQPEADVQRPVATKRQQEVSSEETVQPLPVQEEEPSSTPPPRPPTRRRGGNRRTTTTTEAPEEVQPIRRQPTRARTTSRPVPTPAPVAKKEPWYIPPIECYEPEDGVFYAQMGPTGGSRGYPAITGHVGWGISWYINGLLIPEINVVRGKTYNFIVEGGDQPEVSAKYHPFYITDDPVGGYAYKSDEDKRNVTIFAGAKFENGEAVPTGTGRSCHWTHTGDSEADDFDSFGAYQRTLQLKCDQGEPGVIQWTPDENTPDTVYYQCFTHRHLGWKINVHDTCEQQAASAPQPSIVEAPKDLLQVASIQHETRVKPNTLLLGELTSPKHVSDPIDVLPHTHFKGHTKPKRAKPHITPMFAQMKPYSLKKPAYFYRPVQFYKPIVARQQPTTTSPILMHVDISAAQPSTEKPTDILTSPLLSIHPSGGGEGGFNPDSLVIEGGFKPIISNIQKRVDDISLEMINEGQKGVINISEMSPLFHPSPLELQAEASERASYYLPPPDTGKPKLSPKLPSEIDFPSSSSAKPSKESEEVAPDVLVTFDGRKISGASLTAKPFDNGVTLERGSKATEYLKALPQSVPFRGELPPLNAKVLFNAPSQGVLSRDLDAPLEGSTKLRRV